MYRRLRNFPPPSTGQAVATTSLSLQLVSLQENAGEILTNSLKKRWQDWNETCEPPWSETELDHKIDSAWAEVYDEQKIVNDTLPRAKKRKPNIRAINKLAKGARGKYQEFLDTVVDLTTSGKLQPIPPLEEIIDAMYPNNPLLCRAVGRQWWACTGPREDIRGVESQMEWLVPSPMRKTTGFAVSTNNPKSVKCQRETPLRLCDISFSISISPN